MRVHALDVYEPTAWLYCNAPSCIVAFLVACCFFVFVSSPSILAPVVSRRTFTFSVKVAAPAVHVLHVSVYVLCTTGLTSRDHTGEGKHRDPFLILIRCF